MVVGEVCQIGRLPPAQTRCVLQRLLFHAVADDVSLLLLEVYCLSESGSMSVERTPVTAEKCHILHDGHSVCRIEAIDANLLL